MIPHQLTQYREENGIRQNFIARKALTSASQVCLIEKRRRWASASLARRLHIATNGNVPMSVFIRPEGVNGKAP